MITFLILMGVCIVSGVVFLGLAYVLRFIVFVLEKLNEIKAGERIMELITEFLTPPENATKPVRLLYRAMTMIFVGVMSLLVLAGASLLLGIVTGGND
jgi:hypothetical protein